MEASDWNETSELKYLTHWMPLPSPPDDVAAPAEQQAQQEAQEPVAWLVTWAGGVHNYVQAHASELPAVDQGRRMAGTVTPLYTEQQVLAILSKHGIKTK